MRNKKIRNRIKPLRVCFIYGILLHNQYTIITYAAEASMNHFQLTRVQQPPKLLTAGRVPLLLTTRVVPASVTLGAKQEKTTADDKRTTIAADDSLLPDSDTVFAAESESALPGVKLLGKLKGGGLTGEQFVPPDECRKCRTANSLRHGETICPRCRLTAHFDVLINERKLSAAAWEKIRRVLCLPKKINNLSKEQSQAALHLLNTFVKRFSFDDQETMTADAARAALRDLPGLSKQFGKAVKGATAAVVAAASAHNGESGTAAAAKRKPVSAQKFTEVAARQGCFCYWCGIKVIREAEIPQKNRISKNHSTVVYLSGDGELREEAVGTIDHLVRVTDGGDNNPANLVISCSACNWEREMKTLAHNRPFARRRVPCQTCGGRFFHPDWGCCSICGAPPERPKKPSSLFEFIARYITGILQKRSGE